MKALVQANRNGYFYALDRTNGKMLVAKAYTKVSWADGINPDGRPRLIAGQDPLRATAVMIGGALGSLDALYEVLTRTIPLAIYTAIQTPGGEADAARLAALSILLALAGLILADIAGRRARLSSAQ